MYGRAVTPRIPARVAAALLALLAAADADAKRKKPKPLFAIVNGTFVVRHDLPGGFGNDEGPNWEQLKVVIKDAKIPFDPPNRIASAKVNVRFEYEAEAHTMDRSYAAGCDREDRTTAGGWEDTTEVVVRPTTTVRKDGKQKPYIGWRVVAKPPKQGIYTVSRGSYQEWESILMDNCLSYEENEPLGAWNSDFARPDGLGKIADDNRSVPLTAINTEVDQTGTVTGSIRFNRAAP